MGAYQARYPLLIFSLEAADRSFIWVAVHLQGEEGRKNVERMRIRVNERSRSRHGLLLPHVTPPHCRRRLFGAPLSVHNCPCTPPVRALFHAHHGSNGRQRSSTSTVSATPRPQSTYFRSLYLPAILQNPANRAARQVHAHNAQQREKAAARRERDTRSNAAPEYNGKGKRVIRRLDNGVCPSMWLVYGWRPIGHHSYQRPLPRIRISYVQQKPTMLLQYRFKHVLRAHRSRPAQSHAPRPSLRLSSPNETPFLQTLVKARFPLR